MALPKEPRQKMINIMYLVLTALLALNVSAEILNAFPAKLSANADKIPFTTQITAAYYALRDPNTSIKVKATLAAAIAYFILPVDLFPDLLAGFGFTDDFAVLLLVLRRLGPAITPAHYELARGRLQRDQESAQGTQST